MAVYSSGYSLIYKARPQNMNIPIRYEIYAALDEYYSTWTAVFNGSKFPIDSELETEIDIIKVCQAYLNTWYESEFFSLERMPLIDNQTALMRFRLDVQGDGYTDSQVYWVKYDWNTDYVSEYPDIGNMNDLIENVVTDNQVITIDDYSADDSYNYRYGILVNGRLITYLPSAVGTGVFNASVFTGGGTTMPGDTITLSNPINTYNFDVIKECMDHYVLHYVNKKGGLDWIVLRGNPVTEWTATKSEVSTFRRNYSPLDFEHKYIRQEITKQYELTTRMLNAEQASKIDNFIYSPKLWLYDSADRVYRSVIVNTSSITKKLYPRDKDLTYTFQVKESQTHLRK